MLLGNIIPIWDDPLWLAEQLAMVDMISGGRLASGWVRGTARESVAHNTAFGDVNQTEAVAAGDSAVQSEQLTAAGAGTDHHRE